VVGLLPPQLDVPSIARVLRERLGLGADALHSPDAPQGAAGGIAIHNREVAPGDAFFALPGAHGHGVDYADDALARGAAFVVSDRPHPRALVVPDAAAALLALGSEARAAWRAPVVAITGSVGKTTMKALLAAALDAPSSQGNKNTTYALAARLVTGWLRGEADRLLVLELGIDHAGEMDGLTALVRPTHGVLTAIAPAHLEGLGGMAGVVREKSRLLEAATERRYAAVGAHHQIAPELAATTMAYGIDAADESGLAAHGHAGSTPAGVVLDARLPGGERLQLTLPGLGTALAEHALGALLVATDLGTPAAVAAERLAGAHLEGRRLQPHRLGALTLIDDSYNASPMSMRLALDVLHSLPEPHAAVLGDMRELGSEAREHHPGLAPLVRDLGTLWAVGPESRALVAGRPGRHYASVDDVLPYLDELPREGTLLVKGSRGIGLDRLVDALLARRRVLHPEGAHAPAADTATDTTTDTTIEVAT
jgi:UDP-N-acetylmuramoyl-tripeptide--D-alanyl-D-alanine ligase